MNEVNGKLVKNLRESLHLSQEEFAEKISVSVSTLHRIEKNETHLDVFHFMDIMHTFDKSVDDFFLLFLDSNQYLEYKKYIGHETLFTHKRLDGLPKNIKLRDNSLVESPHAQLLVAYSKILDTVFYRESNPEVFTAQDLDNLYKAINITINGFNEQMVAGYLLTAVEIYVICDISKALSDTKQHERATNLAKALLSNKTIKARAEIDSSDYANIYVYANLIRRYSAAEMHSEALSYALNLPTHCIKENRLHGMDTFLSLLAECYKSAGEDELHYKSHFIRGYYLTALKGMDYSISAYRKDAKEIFNVELEDWINY